MLGLIARMQLWQQVALSLKAGLTVDNALARAASTPGPGASLARRLRATGEPALADAAARCPEWVPAIETALVRAGEISGKLPETLLVLFERLQQRRERVTRLLLYLCYPTLITLLCVFAGAFAASTASPPTGFALGLVLRLLPFVLFIGVLFGVPALLRRCGESSARLLDAFLLRVPFIGGCFRQEAEAEFLWLMGTMLDAGIDIRETVAFTAANVSNRALRTALEPVAAAVARGEPLGEVVVKVPYVSAQAASRIATAEMSGSLSEVLLLLAQESKEMYSLGRKGVDGAIVGLFTLFMAVFAAWTILGFWFGYYGRLLQP